ncbi:MAG: hypothetical protein ACPIOQ_35720, partial [Promethearchaeia archaeon]
SKRQRRSTQQRRVSKTNNKYDYTLRDGRIYQQRHENDNLEANGRRPIFEPLRTNCDDTALRGLSAPPVAT